MTSAQSGRGAATRERRQWKCFTGHGQLSQAAIGKVLGGLDYTTVSRERKRLREIAQEDKQLGATLREIEDRLRHR
jgi:hypothetical protein